MRKKIYNYKGCNDIVVEYDGKPHQENKDFTDKAKNGMLMSVIAYRSYSDIDVQFEDGVIVRNKTMGAFKKGNIKHPKVSAHKREIVDRTGETIIAHNGMKMTIIAYRSNSDIDVQFEDGTITCNKSYQSFKKGQIPNPQLSSQAALKNRVGETTIAKNGQVMKIIAYRNCRDIDIQFEDGTVVKNRAYHNFRNGCITHSSEFKKVGETIVANNGMKMTIIAYRNCNDIDIQFEDGVIVRNKTYNNFVKGHIQKPINSQ